MTDRFPSSADQQNAGASAANAAALEVIALVEELTQVIEAENALLAEGLPGSTSHLVQRKRELADRFTDRIAALRDKSFRLEEAEPWLQARLHEESKLLRGRMNDNVDSLRRSLAATRRRIDAIMRAIREQTPRPAPGYGADARIPSGRQNLPVRQGRVL